MLTPEVRAAVYSSIMADCSKLGVHVIAIGGTDDHIHVLVRLPPTLSIAALVKQMKGSSSHLANHLLPGGPVLRWQKGYAVFSVSKSVGPTVRDYINNQETHHREGSTVKGMEIAWEEHAPSP